MRKRNSSTVVILSVLVLMLGAMIYLYNSAMFERNVPTIVIEDTIYWNQKEPIVLKVEDDTGVKFVRATLSDGEHSITLLQELFATPQKSLELKLEFPKVGCFSKNDNMNLKIEAVDISKWNLVSGNQADENVNIIKDTKRPDLTILGNSYKITKGGSAIVIFQANDNNLKDLYILTNTGEKFYPMKFEKDGYYISLVAWPRVQNDFKAEIVVNDLAGNTTRETIRYFLQNRNYRTSTIPLTDRFLGGKVSDLAKNYASNVENMTLIERFMFVNQDMRKENNQIIESVTKIMPECGYVKNTLNTFYSL